MAFLTACGLQQDQVPVGEQITLQQLNEQSISQPVLLPVLSPPPEVGEAQYQFSGTLTLKVQQAARYFNVITDHYGYSQNAGLRSHWLPSISLQFVEDNGVLFPVTRGTITTEHPHWDYIFEPGQVWQQSSDQGYSRALIPFALQEKNANCLHNGLLTFLFDSKGFISNTYYQISNESCHYFQFDASGFMATKYTPEAVTTSADMQSQQHRYRHVQAETQDLQQLLAAFPNADIAALAGKRDMAAADISVAGLIIADQHYRSSCPTRYGDHPLCQSLSLPSYSLAKSYFAAFALHAMAREIANLEQQLVSDWVNECAGDEWRGVTLANLVNMNTGLYHSKVYMADEDAKATEALFFDATTHQSKITYACSGYSRKQRPGSQFIYHTSDTYILGTALARMYQQHIASSKDWFADYVVPRIFRPIGLSPSNWVTRRTQDALAQPFTGWGLTLLPEDIVALSGAVVGNKTTATGLEADETIIDKALARITRANAPERINKYLAYAEGFWFRDIAADLNCKQPVWVPFMSGYGGITVAFLPGKVTYYVFADGQSYQWQQALRAIHKFNKLC
ncbi:serine hydrolase domain-containing protein [Thalassotalea mangrovi]|uniref:Beta-lactamase family protein n=1 Tax=Thalassotalea mangrovi TaxID=2572245 RepID=A0A4U1B4S3_9GAMM|nr:serine hydrolase domain-containing protein [Thalassotalea mangrovi]TKB45390.1 beta-lactamase family protein [Thalassotalea mangrovi]